MNCLDRSLLSFFLLIFSLLACPTLSWSQIEFMRFSRISTSDGLSNTNVGDVVQDQQGFIWIATSTGLNRYDGHEVVVYNHNPSDKKSLSSSNISCLYVDQMGRLWVGTQNGGLNLYRAEQDAFTRFHHDPEDSLSISHNFIRAINEDQQGRLWVGTARGLCYLNPDRESFTRFNHQPKDRHSLPHNLIHVLYTDQKGRLWIGSNSGVSQYDPKNKRFINFLPEEDLPKSPRNVHIHGICEDENGELWLGTGYGVKHFIPEKNKFTNYIIDPDSSLHNRIYSLISDKKGHLWAAVWGVGLSLFSVKDKTFSAIPNRNNDPTSLSSIYINGIYQDHSGLIWMGSLQQGLFIYKPALAGFVYHKSIEGQPSIKPGPITAILVNDQNEIWLSNHNEIVEKIHPDGQISHYTSFKQGSKNASAHSIFDIFEDRDKNIWIAGGNSIFKLEVGTTVFYQEKLTEEQYPYLFGFCIYQDKAGFIWIGTNQGLFRYNSSTKKYTHFKANPEDPRSLSDRTVYEIYEDKGGALWVGTKNGLNLLDRKTGKFTHYKHEPDQLSSISSNLIYVIYEDQSGNLWVGTEAGLNLLDRKKGSFKRYMHINGSYDNTIYGLMEDAAGNLWISSRKHIYQWNPKNESGKTYDQQNGMPMPKFFRHAFFRDQKGNMFLGGNEGFLRFHPKRLAENKLPPRMALSDFRLFNRRVSLANKGEESSGFSLEKGINHTEKIELSYKDHIFSFEFVALDFTAPAQNQYAYKLEGWDDEWLYTDANNRLATYNRISPGTYTFKVKGSNSDGVWSEEIKSIQVIIHPPWWKTTGAYILYGLLFLGGLFGFIQWRAARLEKEKRILTQLVKEKTLDLQDKNAQLEQQALKLIELDETKTRFFANISHEFRTPLTVILGLVQKQIKNAQNHLQSHHPRLIQRNADRLLQLINQLLDLSKLESGQIKLKKVEFDIYHLTKKIIFLFESTYLEKEIKVRLNQKAFMQGEQSEELLVELDQEKIQKILNNLISNAVKFTPAEGEIWVDIFAETDAIRMRVSNTGTPIPAESLPRLFDRFYQVDTAITREYEGSGIGLALVKELVELQQGEIEVESDGEKTTFSFVLPTKIIKQRIAQSKEIPLNAVEKGKPKGPQTLKSSSTERVGENAGNLLQVLVVEDNADLRTYITSVLEEDFQVITAVNGQEGLEKAEAQIPDLIVSDVMMPKMDGYEFCKTLKSNDKTNHIPVILLTAKASQENKLEGLETGADDYLIKPFDESELSLRAKNLIQIRSQLQQKYQQEIWLKPKEVKVTSLQQKFLEELKAILEERLSDDTFTVEMLGQEVGLSRSQLHRKLKALTDQSATTFIRHYRLHRAADLLKNNSGTVTEIAYQVGFNSQTYFSSSFQKLFGCSPSEYLEKV